jgi:hypothetical protein
MPHQLAVTVRANVRTERLDDLGQLLAEINKSGPVNHVLPFGRLAGVHFARLFILPEVTDLAGEAIPPSLVYMSEVDAPLDRHLDDLVRVAGPGLDRIFGHCADYLPQPVCAADRVRWIRAHFVSTRAFYVNTVGRGVEQIRQEAELRGAVESFLDQSRADLSGHGARQARAAVQAFVAGRPDLAWAQSPPAPPSLLWRAKETAHLLAVPLVGLAASPLLAPALPVWAALLRWHERRDVPSMERPDLGHLRELADLEDFVAQNPFTAVGLLKPGRFRRLTAGVVLELVDYGIRHIFNHGSLTGVKTIHFARWVFLDDKRRLLFASNYDGSVSSYQDDFINLVAWGLNAVFSAGVGYPRTSWLVLAGARQEQVFKNWEYRQMLPTQVWYSAYDSLTAKNIADNARLRAGLSGEMTESAAAAWLALL